MKPPSRNHLETWLTKPETAERLQVSFKTIEKWVKAGKLQSAKRKHPGRVDATVYHPDDVAQLEQERDRQPGAFVVPAVREVREQFANPLGQLAHVFTEGLREVREQFAKPPERLFLSVKEASELSGLTQRYLRQLLADGKLE